SPVCKPNTQSKPTTPLPGFPRLQAPPGAHILARHTENGHVSRAEAPDAFSGYTYWYGTSKPSTSHTLQNVLDWTSDGTGGKGDGRFLSRGTYDDGECAEPGDTVISKERGIGPGGQIKSCVDNFTLPGDLEIGSTYSVYWVWDFSGHFGSKNTKHIEWYTSCIDIDIVASYGAGRSSGSGNSNSGNGNTGGGTRETSSSGGSAGSTASNTGSSGSGSSGSSGTSGTAGGSGNSGGSGGSRNGNTGNGGSRSTTIDGRDTPALQLNVDSAAGRRYGMVP
ncbi:hypothetical protein L873DRAFT_1709393, partial [Choiromyces venosus 120613-1]